jgi:hypothetical protein
MKSGDIKKRISAVIKFIFDTATKLQATIVRFIESEKFRVYLNNFGTKTGLFSEWIVKTTTFFFQTPNVGQDSFVVDINRSASYF